MVMMTSPPKSGSSRPSRPAVPIAVPPAPTTSSGTGSPFGWVFENSSADQLRELEKKEGGEWVTTKNKRSDIPFIGSAVAGKAIGNASGATASDIPWLKLEVTSKRGSGVLTPVTTVQRINTLGGKLEGACDKAGATSSGGGDPADGPAGCAVGSVVHGVDRGEPGR